MGNTESSDIKELCSKEVMSINEKKWLIKEFDKEKNIFGYISDVDVLIRVEKVVDGKKHYYFNISAFFDPDKGFLKCFSDIYKRYEDIRNLNPDDIMPFCSLIFRPLEEIQQTLKIVPGSYLDYSLCLFYSIGFSMIITGITIFLASKIHPFIGGAFYFGILLKMLYEEYKGVKEIVKIQKIENENDFLVGRILDLFSSLLNDKIFKANIIEIVVDESYSNLMQALVSEAIIKYVDSSKAKEKIKIKLWNIPEINKAKRIEEFPDLQKEFISNIIEEMNKIKDDDSLYKIYDELGKRYRESYKKSQNLIKKNQDLEKENKVIKNKNDKIKKLYEELEELRKKDPNDPKIDKYNKELKDLLCN